MMEMDWFLTATVLLVTLSVIPLWVDFLRFLFPHRSLSRIVGKSAHIFLFINVSGLFIIIIRYHIFVYLPLLLNHKSPFDSPTGVLHIVFSFWLWLNTLGNYYYTISLHPGVDNSFRYQKSKRKKISLSQSNGTTHENATRMETGLVLKKNRTKISPTNGVEWKPQRTNFCYVCHCAVLYWDHHCPFTGNCIGLRNYSNFFAGLCYGVLGGLYALTVTWPFFYKCTVLPFFGDKYGRETACIELGANSYIFLLVLLGVWLVFCTLILNIVLLLADLSTHDVLKYWGAYPIPKYIVQRICAKKFMDCESRICVLLLNRSLLWYLLPVRSSNIFIPKPQRLVGQCE